NATSAPSGTFDTADGKLNIAANKQQQYDALCRLLDRPDLRQDPRFADREARKRHRAELRAELEHTLRTRPAEHWERELSAVGVPAARVLSVPEALSSSHVRERGLVHELALPAADGGRIRVLGAGVCVDGQALAPGAPPPLLGEHTDEVLAEAGLTAAEIVALRREGVA
ncbi:MAG TPA: CoA transferase, partial [Pilimelia sp.]|nr:CoA transferase [Pilimelia sp.]